MAQAKADNVKRIIAAFIDGIIAGILGAVLGSVLAFIPFIGGFIAGLIPAAYIGFKDAFPIDGLNGASPGKKLFGMKAVAENGGNCDYQTSLKRNAPFVLPYVIMALLGIIPILGTLIGIFLVPIIAFIIYIIELILLLNNPDGRRWGDKFADTRVIELTAPAAAPPPPPGNPPAEDDSE